MVELGYGVVALVFSGNFLFVGFVNRFGLGWQLNGHVKALWGRRRGLGIWIIVICTIILRIQLDITS